MSVDAKYKTTATASGGGHDGKTALADATISLDLVVPKELGDPGDAGANPWRGWSTAGPSQYVADIRVGRRCSDPTFS